MSRGRILSGFARGVPREYNVYDVSMAESRARFEEAVDIILKAWTEPKFSHEGKFWSVQGHRDLAAALSAAASAGVDAVHRLEGNHRVGRQAQLQRRHSRSSPRADAGHRRLLTPSSSRRTATRSRRSTCASSPTPMWRRTAPTAIKEYSPYYFYFVHTLWHHGSLEKAVAAEGHRLSVVVVARLHQAGEPRRRGRRPRGRCRRPRWPTSSARSTSGELSWGSPKDVADKLIAGAERMGANSLLLNMNVGAMAHDVFLEQIRRFGKEVLPRLQAHQVKRVPAAGQLSSRNDFARCSLIVPWSGRVAAKASGVASRSPHPGCLRWRAAIDPPPPGQGVRVCATSDAFSQA